MDGSDNRKKGIGTALLDCSTPVLLYLAVNIGLSLPVSFAVLVAAFLDLDVSVIEQGNGILLLSIIMDLILIPIAYFMYRHDKKVLGLPYRLKDELPPGIVDSILCLLMGMGATIVLNVGLNLLGLQWIMEEFAPERLDLFGQNPVIEFLALCILAPVAEELLFRVLLFGRLRKYMRFIFAALISAAVFGIVHLEPLTAVSAFLIGLVMAYIYEKKRSIFITMLFHFGFNLVPTMLDILNNLLGFSAEDIEYEFEGYSEGYIWLSHLIYIVIGAVLFLITLYFFIKRNRKNDTVLS